MTQHKILKDHVNKRMDWTEYFEYLVQRFKSYAVSILTRKKNDEELEWQKSRSNNSNKVHPNPSQVSFTPIAGGTIPPLPPLAGAPIEVATPPRNRKMSRFDELL